MLKSPLKDQAERDQVNAAVARLSTSARPEQIMARVAALLTPYYTGDVPHGVRMIEAEDWAEALATYPEWAITKACRWWKGSENPNRRKKPLEGDIVARTKTEMGVISVAEVAIRQFDSGQQPYNSEQSESEQRPTADERERIQALVAEMGYAPKRMGGQS